MVNLLKVVGTVSFFIVVSEAVVAHSVHRESNLIPQEEDNTLLELGVPAVNHGLLRGRNLGKKNQKKATGKTKAASSSKRGNKNDKSPRKSKKGKKWRPGVGYKNDIIEEIMPIVDKYINTKHDDQHYSQHPTYKPVPEDKVDINIINDADGKTTLLGNGNTAQTQVYSSSKTDVALDINAQDKKKKTGASNVEVDILNSASVDNTVKDGSISEAGVVLNADTELDLHTNKLGKNDDVDIDIINRGSIDNVVENGGDVRSKVFVGSDMDVVAVVGDNSEDLEIGDAGKLELRNEANVFTHLNGEAELTSIVDLWAEQDVYFHADKPLSDGLPTKEVDADGTSLLVYTNLNFDTNKNPEEDELFLDHTVDVNFAYDGWQNEHNTL